MRKRFIRKITVVSMAVMMTAAGGRTAFAEEIPDIDATGTVYDLGGQTLPICEPGEVSLTYMGNDTWCAGVSYNDGTAVQKEIEKRTGVHIEWDTYSSDVETVLQTRMASLEGLPDMVEVPPFDSNVGVDTYSRNGILIPLNDLIAEYAPNIQALFESTRRLRQCVPPLMATSMLWLDGGAISMIMCRTIFISGRTGLIIWDWKCRAR